MCSLVEEISIREFDQFRIGNAQDMASMTGVTAIVFDKANKAGVDISGGGPASRETNVLNPIAAEQSLTALILSGGSAYGLEAASGAMQYLEERGRGYRLKDFVVPIVPQSCIFDLCFGDGRVRPDKKMGYEACLDAEKNNPVSGNIGAGAGATAGKIYGMKRASKCGIGYGAVKCGKLKVGAVVVVNAFGDIFDFETGKKISGALTEDRKGFASCEAGLLEKQGGIDSRSNTTIGAVFTNGNFSQQATAKIASMARSGYSRSINPVGTMGDGDTIYAVSFGEVESDINVAGVLAARAVSMAVRDAALSSKMSDEEYLSHIK